MNQVEGTNKGRGRPKITLLAVVKKDVSIKEVTKAMTVDRIECKKRIHMAIPNLSCWGFKADPKKFGTKDLLLLLYMCINTGINLTLACHFFD